MSKARGSYRVDPLGHKKKSPVLLNGLTEAETNATASVMGLVEQKVLEHAPCLGMNCGITRTDQMHSAECQAEHAATIAGGKFVKPAQQQSAERGEPVAWRTFDGEGGYDYRTYDMNENYAKEWDKQNPKHKGWVEPLYTSPPAQPSKPWVGLEPGEISKIATSDPLAWANLNTVENRQYFARAIEAKLREKNT